MIDDKKISPYKKRQTMHKNNYEIFFYKGMQNVVFEEHFHKHYEIYFYIGNEVNFKVNSNIYNIKKGDIVLIPPDTFHSVIIQDNLKGADYTRIVLWISHYYIENLVHFNSDIKTCFEKCIKNNSYVLRTNTFNLSKIINILSSIYNESVSSLEYSDAYVKSYIVMLLLDLNRISLYENISKMYIDEKDILITGILDYIDQNFTQKITLKDVADSVFVSTSTLSHLFKKRFNVSFYRFIQKKRLIVAKNNILRGMPINKAWENCGFNDYSSFFRAFKKEYGVSPKEFKNTGKTSQLI